MHGISVALLTGDHDHLNALQSRLEATRLARVEFSHVGFPAGPTDAIQAPPADAPADGRGVLAPWVATGCRIAMGVTMAFMLLIMI